MKFGASALLIGVGLVIVWLGVTGRLSNLGRAWAELTGAKEAQPGVTPTSGPLAGAGPITGTTRVPYGVIGSPGIVPARDMLFSGGVN